MADNDIGNVWGFVDKRRGRGVNAGGTEPVAGKQNLYGIAEMKTRLTAINSTYFNAAKLNNMTENDMVYALRLNDDAAGV